MSLGLLVPGALAGLAALAVPLALHLVRRAREREHDFAALRWIAARPRPRRRVRLQERALLALRLALVAGVVLLLAAPAWRASPSPRPWLLLAPGVELGHPDLRAALDAASAGPEDARPALHWLAPGLPAVALDASGAPRALAVGPDAVAGAGASDPLASDPLTIDPLASGPLASPASLLRELDARLPPDVALQAWVPATLDGMDGERPALGRAIDWRVLPAAATAAAAADAATAAPTAGARPRLALRAPDARGEAARVLAGVLRAWAVEDGGPAATLDASSGTDAPSGDADTLVWLHPTPPGDDVLGWAAEGRTLVVEPASGDATDATGPVEPATPWRDEAGDPIATAEPLGEGRLLRLRVALRTDALPALRSAAFPRTLAEVLRPPPAPGRGDAQSLAPRHAPSLALDAAARAGLDADRHDLRPWLALLLGLLAVAERLLALRLGRWSA